MVYRIGADTPGYTSYGIPVAGNFTQALQSDKSPASLAAALQPLAPSPDLEEAERLLRRGVAAGYPAATANLANLLCGTQRTAEAEALLRPAAEAGDVNATAVLVSLLMRNHVAAGAEFGKYPPEVPALLERWAQTGDATALLYLGMHYDDMGRHDEALGCLRKAAAAGNTAAQAGLLANLVMRELVDEARDLVLEMLADPELRALDALEVFFASPPPSEADLTALRSLRETHDVDAFLNALREE